MPVSAAVFAFLLHPRLRLWEPAVCALFLAAGVFFGAGARGLAERESRIAVGQPLQNVRGVSGVLLDDPRASAFGRGFGRVRLAQSVGLGCCRVSARGVVGAFFPEDAVARMRQLGRGSSVFLSGVFLAGKDGPRFRAQGVHIVAPPSPIDLLRTRARLGLVEAFSGKGEAWGGLALALLLGVRDKLEGVLAAKYREAGCSYILALSGMHLAIIQAILAFLLKKPLGVKAAAASGAAFTLFYLFLAGAQPSLVRAAFMSIAAAAAVVFSFPAKTLEILSLSFLSQIAFDAGSGLSASFILSYLALSGLLLVGRSIEGALRGCLPSFLLSPLASSLGAFAATAPVVVFFFGVLRPVGILSGLALSPLSALFMAGSLLFLVLHFTFPPLSAPLGAALSQLYKLIEMTAAAAARFPAVAPGASVFVLALGSALPFVIFCICRHRISARLAIEAFD